MSEDTPLLPILPCTYDFIRFMGNCDLLIIRILPAPKNESVKLWRNADMIIICPVYLYTQLNPGQILTILCIDHPKSKRNRQRVTGQSRPRYRAVPSQIPLLIGRFNLDVTVK
jgi:hypothetical protein